MSALIVTPHEHAVKHNRFVAPTPEAQDAAEREFLRQVGRNYYRRGYDLSACNTDEETAGWLACEAAGERFGWKRSTAARGADAYYAGMMAEASSVQCVNWNSGAEVW